MKSALDRLVSEARGELGKSETRSVDWRAVDDALFEQLDERLEDEKRAEATEAQPARWRSRAWMLAGAGLAAAVAVAMLGGRAREARPLEAAAFVAPGAVALVSGDAVVGGRAAPTGAELHAGDVIEARGPVRAEVRGKAWLLVEGGSRARVAEVGGGLVLVLERGAVEADVNPVAEGEAFAVDVVQGEKAVRVAVHGTHLRVARGGSLAGDRVTIDLNEGVVSVGTPPRSGSTLGSLVTAPAHAEFAVGDAVGTLSVSHDAGSVRAPVSLRPSSQPRAAIVSPPPPSTRTDAPPSHGNPATAALAALARGEARPPPSTVDAPPPSAAPPALPPVDANAEATLAAAVRACMRRRARARQTSRWR